MRVYRLEVKLNKEQQALYKLNISACRFVYNLYIQENEGAYREGKNLFQLIPFTNGLIMSISPYMKIWDG